MRSERKILKHILSLAAAIGIPIMCTTTRVLAGRYEPELLARMFEAIDNVTMAKESTGDLSRMERIEALSDGRRPFSNRSNPLVLDALRAGAAGWCTAAAGL
jgi:4-hydroxy-tetrahydrodipicolinate synthase